MLRPYLKIWEREWIFGRAVKAISSPGVRSPCTVLCGLKSYSPSIFLCTCIFVRFFLYRQLSSIEKNQNSKIQVTFMITDYGRLVRKSLSLHGRKSTPTPKILGTAEAYFVCHIGHNFQISLIYAFIGCP